MKDQSTQQGGDAEAAALAAAAGDLEAAIASLEHGKGVETPVEKTKKRIIGMAPTIYRLLDKGAQMSTVRDIFLFRFPDSLVEDVDRALNALRVRRQRDHGTARARQSRANPSDSKPPAQLATPGQKVPTSTRSPEPAKAAGGSASSPASPPTRRNRRINSAGDSTKLERSARS